MSTKTGAVRRAPESRVKIEATRPPRKKERSRRPQLGAQKPHPPAPNLAAPKSLIEHPGRRRKRRLLLALAVLFMVVGVSLLVYPFLPMIRYALIKPAPTVTYETALTDVPAGTTVTTDEGETIVVNPVEQPKRRGSVKPKPASNRLVIPKIGVDVAIVEGKNQDVALNQGIWHIPGTSTPDKGSNTVLSGHRFRFLSGPRTLYLLDRVKKGDLMSVYWKGKEYRYVVTGQKIVKPNQVEILDPTDKPRLTVFTCSPLFSTKERLVLFAKPI